MAVTTWLTDSYPAVAGLDTALNSVLLRQVAAGSRPETFRLYQVGRVLAFGKRDRVSPGFPLAVAGARSSGFAPVVRLAGGRAAVFHEGTIGFGWIMATGQNRTDIHGRFQSITQLLVRAFRRLEVPTAVGEVPGEYCPGQFSIHNRLNRKVVGIGQRLNKRAAMVGGVIVVSRPDLVNRPLGPVHKALNVDWDPKATGALSDVSEVGSADVADAIMAELALMYELTSEPIGTSTLAASLELIDDHVVSQSL